MKQGAPKLEMVGYDLMSCIAIFPEAFITDKFIIGIELKIQFTFFWMQFAFTVM